MRTLPSYISWLTTERLLTILLFVAAFLGISGYSSDLFLHLAAGKYLATAGMLPEQDPFSFSRPDAPWVMHEWLYQLATYSLYALGGGTALKLFGALLVSLTFYLNRRSCRLLGAGQVVSWAVTLLLFLAWLEFLGVRPQSVTYLFFSLTLHLLLRYRYRNDSRSLYLIPLIMPLWVNSHGGFLLGILLPGFLWLLTLLEVLWQERQWHNPRPLMTVMLLASLTSLINPYGYRLLLFPFHLMDQWAIGYITEWQPPNLDLWNNRLYLVTVLVFVILLLISSSKDRWFRLTFVAPLVVASFMSVRHLPLAALIIAPFFAAQTETLLSTLRQRRQEVGRAEMQRHLGNIELVLNWLLLVLFTFGVAASYPAYQRFAATNVRHHFPIGATQYLVEHAVEGRMFAPMGYSDYILFIRYPQQKIFFDVRVEMYGKELARDYLTMVNGLEGWQALFERYGIDYAVLDKRHALYAALYKSSAYRLVYEDDSSAVFMRAVDKNIVPDGGRT